MDHKNLFEEIEKLKSEINQLKAQKKLSLLERFKQKSRFVQGLIIGLSLSSFWALAQVAAIGELWIFAPNQVISASKINENFAYLENLVGQSSGSGTLIQLAENTSFSESGADASMDFSFEGTHLSNLDFDDDYEDNMSDAFARVWSFQVSNSGWYIAESTVNLPQLLNNFTPNGVSPNTSVNFGIAYASMGTPSGIWDFMFFSSGTMFNYNDGELGSIMPPMSAPIYYLDQNETYYIVFTASTYETDTYTINLNSTDLRITLKKL
jgi:hypothetical protein